MLTWALILSLKRGGGPRPATTGQEFLESGRGLRPRPAGVNVLDRRSPPKAPPTFNLDSGS